MDDTALQYGAWGFVALLAVQFVLPALRDYVLPAQKADRERRAHLEERQINAIEGLNSAIQKMGTTLAGIDLRLASVEREQERTNDRLTSVESRLPNRRGRDASPPPTARTGSAPHPPGQR
jgi:chromosome segregation ATPase